MNDEAQLAIHQFKITNGDEIIAVIQEWGDGDFIVRAPLRMVEIPFDFEDENRAFVFRPWMNYQDNIDREIVLSALSVVAFYEPSDHMKEGYLNAVEEVREFFGTEYKTEVRTRSKKKRPKSDGNVISMFDDSDPSIH